MDGMSPEELFEAFFGPSMSSGIRFSTSGFPQTRRYYSGDNRRQHQHQQQFHRQQEGGAGFFTTIIQFLPILLILFFALFGGKSESVYSLNKEGGHVFEQHTDRHQVPYWTKKDFSNTYPPSSYDRNRFEEDIEYQWYTITVNQCKSELTQKKKAQSYARYWGSDEDVRHAKNMRTPSCDLLTSRNLRAPT